MLTLLERPDASRLCLVRPVQWSPDGRCIAAVVFRSNSKESSSTVMLWKPAESCDPVTLGQFPGRIMSLAFAAGGRYHRLLVDATACRDLDFVTRGRTEDVRAANQALGRLWSWFVNEFAHSESCWYAYPKLLR